LALTACTAALVDERTFDRTRWHVTAIDGAPTPVAGDYHVEFSRRSISGRFGCNGFGGSFSVLGDIMNAGNVTSTMMACSEPAAGFESHGFAILRLPMQMRWTGGTRLTLSNSAGTIELERLP
jgi:heat shock protein HslJ